MKHNVRVASIQAYRKLKEQGIINAQELEIVTYLLQTGNKAMTRREICEGTGMLISSVAGRVNSLIEKKVLAESFNRICKISGMTVTPVYVKIDNQGEIF